MRTLKIRKPDDWHLHFRDGDWLNETVPATARCFSRAIVMPNLVPPVTNARMATAYKERILLARPKNSQFEPLMTLYLTDQTTPKEIQQAHKAGVTAVKLYPSGATTNSTSGVTALQHTYAALEAMADLEMPLLIHGEVTDPDIDIFDREKVFIDRHLFDLTERLPELKVVLEHITTAEAVDFVTQAHTGVAATITPQHLLLNRNDFLVGGIRPHNYCLPVLKRDTHQAKLQLAATSGLDKFFLGSDSAPHARGQKESDCGCAGCYSAWGAIELYAHIFDALDGLDKLENFASLAGPKFYGLPLNSEFVTLVNEPWSMPQEINLESGETVVPFFAGQTLNWRLAADV